MRRLLICLAFAVTASFTQAQDPGMLAAQIATQNAQMAAQQAQQAAQQAMQDAQLANQQAMQAAQIAAMNAQCSGCYAAMPKFSTKAGTYTTPVNVIIKSRGATAIYYTTDGWTPTIDSARYSGPITIGSNTTLQAVAISKKGLRSRVATAVYEVSAAPPAGGPITLAPVTSGVAPAAGKIVLHQGTAIPLAFAADVTSKTARLGDKVAVTLAEDLTADGVLLAKKGAPANVTLTAVDRPRGGGTPGEIYFRADSLEINGTDVKLRGSAALQGQDQVDKASALMIGLPVGIFVHGKDAEIKQGAVFTAYVDADTVLPAQ